MANKELEEYLQQVWSGQARDQISAELLQAAMHAGHFERAKAFKQIKMAIQNYILDNIKSVRDRLHKHTGNNAACQIESC